MAYNNVPQANQRISDTQPLIQSNFQQIQTAFSLNHVPIADASGNQGKHNFVTFPVQNPAPTITSPDIGLYSFADAISGLNQLYFVNTANTVTNVPFTSCRFANTGYAYFAGGILVKWGNATSSGGNPNSVTFLVSASIPVFSETYTVLFTPASNPGGNIFYLSPGSITTTGFNITPTGTALSLYYIAIGR